MRERENSGSDFTRKRSRRVRACSFETTNLNVLNASLVAFNAGAVILFPEIRQCYSQFPCRLEEAGYDGNVLDMRCYARSRRLLTSGASGLPELRSEKSPATNL